MASQRLSSSENILSEKVCKPFSGFLHSLLVSSSSPFPEHNLYMRWCIKTSELIFGICIVLKTDVCIANAIVKTGMGFGAGVIVSVVAFKSKHSVSTSSLSLSLSCYHPECRR
jgi:hypothetical protein